MTNWMNSGKSIFNSSYHYSLHDIHYLLSLDYSLRRYLPPLWRVSGTILDELKGQHDRLELIPEQDIPAGESLYLTRVDDGDWEISIPNHSEKTELREDLILALQIMNYCIRPELPLLKTGSQPYVVRVCVQKDETASWKITGMSDVPDWKRAQTDKIPQAIDRSELKKDELYNHICVLSKQICELLHLSLPSIAEVGLEIGITTEGKPLFLRWFPTAEKMFMQLGLKSDIAPICQTPIGYARYLLEKRQQMFTEQQHALSP